MPDVPVAPLVAAAAGGLAAHRPCERGGNQGYNQNPNDPLPCGHEKAPLVDPCGTMASRGPRQPSPTYPDVPAGSTATAAGLRAIPRGITHPAG